MIYFIVFGFGIFIGYKYMQIINNKFKKLRNKYNSFQQWKNESEDKSKD